MAALFGCFDIRDIYMNDHLSSRDGSCMSQELGFNQDVLLVPYTLRYSGVSFWMNKS